MHAQKSHKKTRGLSGYYIFTLTCVIKVKKQAIEIYYKKTQKSLTSQLSFFIVLSSPETCLSFGVV